VRAQDRDWMAHIDREVRAVCDGKNWRRQVRRAESIPPVAVDESPLEDYYWKLIPPAYGLPAHEHSKGFEGTYYTLRVNRLEERFVFQHDTFHSGQRGAAIPK